MSSRLHVTSSSALGFVARFFGAMGSNPAIQYVAPNGNDAASGADWTNAKQTILAAYDALPAVATSTGQSGGTIFIANGSYVGGEVPGQGIWIMGPTDPLYATPPAGWRKNRFAVKFVGVGQPGGANFDVGNAVRVMPGQPTGSGTWPADTNHPFIWISGCGPIWFESLHATGPLIGMRIGVSADQTNRSSVVGVGIMFKDIGIEVPSGGGPVVDIGYSFWLYFDNCAFVGAYYDAPPTLTPYALTDDRHAVMRCAPQTGQTAPGLITIRNNRWAAGGLKITGGNTGNGSYYIEDLFVESNGTLPLPPVVWITNLVGTWSGVLIRGVQKGDDGPGGMATVQIDGNVNFSDAVTCIEVAGVIQGPATVLGNNFLLPTSASPLRMGQVGVATRRLVGPHDSARRRFAPTAVRFANLAQQDVTLWSGLVGSATVTTGQTAPDGTANAALLTSASAEQNRQPYHANRTYAVGDIVVIGGWMKQTAPGAANGPLVSFSIIPAGFSFATLDGGTLNTAIAVPPFQGDGEWVWSANAVKITAIGTNPAATQFQLNVWSGNPSVFYAPIFLHIPAGTVSDNEAAELMTHLQPWSNNATVGHISPLDGQIINAIGGFATRTKAGAPVDGDYAAPVDGLVVTDTTNNKIWTRIGGVWKGVAVT